MPRLRLTVVCLCCFAAGCGFTRNSGPPAIGQAFAGPSKLILHKDIDPKSPASGIAHHGDKLDILAQRRRWYKVRTARGIEGWTDDRQLLDSRQMQRLRRLAEETAGLPPQGVATSFGELNVHTEPNRLAPSFLQVREGEKFDVVVHRVMARGTPPKRRLVEPKPKVPKRGREKKSKFPEPAAPEPPKVPSNWLELSRQRGIPVEDVADQEVPQDDWSLIRTKSGQSGWVLTGRLFMAIPDEVAQYAEGHRIMSYASLGKIQDGDVQKNIWLWTTAEKLGEDHDFDGYRVFVWSLKRHRYETAYIQRRVRGFFPVIARPGEFSVCLENDDGTRTRKAYSMLGNQVRPAGEQPCERKSDAETAAPEQLAANPVTAPASAAKPAIQRLIEKIHGWLGK